MSLDHSRPIPSLWGCDRTQESKVAAVVSAEDFLRI
jgi:hypothetical protein